MDFLAQAATTLLTGTITIPEGPLPTISVSSNTAKPTMTHGPSHGHGHGGPHHGPHHGGWHPNVEGAGKVGQSALMAYTVIFGLAALITLILSKRVERKLRLFHNITLVIIVTAFLSYLAMATGMGVSVVPSYKAEGGRFLREVYYARYIDWALTTPLLLLDLALLAGLPLTTTILVMLADEAMIVTGLIAGLSKRGEGERWVWFGVSCLFLLYVLFTLLVSGMRASKLQSTNVQNIYLVTMSLTVGLWVMYPIVFGLTEGRGVISVDAEIIAYGILDVLAKVGFGMYLLIAHSHTEGDSVVISEFWTEPRNGGAGYGAISLTD